MPRWWKHSYVAHALIGSIMWMLQTSTCLTSPHTAVFPEMKHWSAVLRTKIPQLRSDDKRRRRSLALQLQSKHLGVFSLPFLHLWWLNGRIKDICLISNKEHQATGRHHALSQETVTITEYTIKNPLLGNSLNNTLACKNSTERFWLDI